MLSAQPRSSLLVSHDPLSRGLFQYGSSERMRLRIAYLVVSENKSPLDLSYNVLASRGMEIVVI